VAVFLAAASGVGVAARQVWLQHLPKEQVPPCGPDLFFMMENMPLARTLQLLFRGSGQCAEVDWTFLSLSIAEWSLAWFILFAALGVALAWKK
jgi:disulfide bond formation protein DsbB